MQGTVVAKVSTITVAILAVVPLLPTLFAASALAAPKAAAAKAPVGKASDAAWHKLVDTAERYLYGGDLATGLKYYVAAVQGAVSAKASCTDLKFRQLLAMGGSVCALGARPLGGESPASDTGRCNSATETALKWKLHAATTICGTASSAYAEALENLVAFYVTTGNHAMQMQYSEKSAQAEMALPAQQKADLEILRNATHGRTEAVSGAHPR